MMFTRTCHVYPALKEATGSVCLRGEQGNSGLLRSTSCGRSILPQAASPSRPFGMDWIEPGS